MLYSLSDRNYYIIFQLEDEYKEYVVTIDSICNVLRIKEVRNDLEIEKLKAKKFLPQSKRKLLKRLEEDRQTIRDAFQMSQYRMDFITSCPDATYVTDVTDVPSYFVMKDENDKRYGEYRLPSITIPCPINPNLLGYLIRTLTENIAAGCKL